MTQIQSHTRERPMPTTLMELSPPRFTAVCQALALKCAGRCACLPLHDDELNTLTTPHMLQQARINFQTGGASSCNCMCLSCMLLAGCKHGISQSMATRLATLTTHHACNAR